MLYRSLQTPGFECNSQASAEIHSITCHKHLLMYLLSIKSFLRFYNDVLVVVHNDGTLTNKDKSILKKHIKGVKIIDKNLAEAKVLAVLKDFPNSVKYRKDYLIARQVFDYLLLSQTDKIISLDSDTLFFKKPVELINWLRNNSQQIIYSYEENPHQQQVTLANIGYNYQPNICVGLMCFYQDILNLELIEKIISKIDKLDWWTTQNIYPVLIKNKADKYQLSFFEPKQYQNLANFQPGNIIFRHYWSSSGISREQLNDSQKVINELKYI